MRISEFRHRNNLDKNDNNNTKNNNYDVKGDGSSDYESNRLAPRTRSFERVAEYEDAFESERSPQQTPIARTEA